MYFLLIFRKNCDNSNIVNKKKGVRTMLEIIKALYEAIISIFSGEVDEGTQDAGIFAGIKAAFDKFFASIA